MSNTYAQIYSKVSFLTKTIKTIDNMEIKQREKDKMKQAAIEQFNKSYGNVDITKLTNIDDIREESTRLYNEQP